jgi:hypothetical protein
MKRLNALGARSSTRCRTFRIELTTAATALRGLKKVVAIRGVVAPAPSLCGQLGTFVGQGGSCP